MLIFCIFHALYCCLLQTNYIHSNVKEENVVPDKCIYFVKIVKFAIFLV